jgi:hypothetical protein
MSRRPHECYSYHFYKSVCTPICTPALHLIPPISLSIRSSGGTSPSPQKVSPLGGHTLRRHLQGNIKVLAHRGSKTKEQCSQPILVRARWIRARPCRVYVALLGHGCITPNQRQKAHAEPFGSGERAQPEAGFPNGTGAEPFEKKCGQGGDGIGYPLSPCGTSPVSAPTTAYTMRAR